MASGILLRTLKRKRQDEGYPAVGYCRPKTNGSAHICVLVPSSPRPRAPQAYFTPFCLPQPCPSSPSLVPAPQTYCSTPRGLLQPPVLPQPPKSINDFSSQTCFSSSALTQPP